MLGKDGSVPAARRPVSAAHIALLVVGLLGVSGSGPLMAGATMVPAMAMSFWRTGLGAIAITPLALTRHRANLANMARREVVRSVFAGLMLAGHFATWVSALHYTSVASATALVCLQVAWVVLIARLSGHRITREVGLGLLLSLLGVVVVSGVDVTISTEALVGDVLALGGGIFAALYITVGSSVRVHATTTTYTFVCYTTSAIVLLASCLAFGVDLGGYGAKGWLLIASVTLVAQLLGHSIFNHLLSVMSPTVVSMVLLLEVPGAALLAGVFLSQTPPIGVYIGLAFILGGMALVLRARGESDLPAEAAID
jgi:drug/metabolite transporter (DMT)-like permease